MATFLGYTLAAAVFVILALPAYYGHRNDRRINRQLREATARRAKRPAPAPAEAFGQNVGHGYRHTPRTT